MTGTGLTHRASADNRDRMHQAAAAGQLTDSMRMYLSGVDGGRPAAGAVGVQPEWFYKGTGAILRATASRSSSRRSPTTAARSPRSPAATSSTTPASRGASASPPGNEFADHVMERKNYLYLAHSKLRECADRAGARRSTKTFAALTGQ